MSNLRTEITGLRDDFMTMEKGRLTTFDDVLIASEVSWLYNSGTLITYSDLTGGGAARRIFNIS